MKNNFILISGRPDTGKTELILLYCNQYPETTLLISEEYSEENIRKRGLNKKATVIGQDRFNEMNLSKYKTICIDYVELFDKEILQSIIQKSLNMGIIIIAVTMMRRDFKVNNIFQSIITL
ncbi:MAG: hypothetical protein HN334_02255 [Candidatus Cloacimonetes bacterium]|mgnify:CR=1 FL=1|jgi:predicted ATP-dependent serine protease|nr:hypothetical protein [Candidatus Cloacimonadota bacterium]